MRGPESNVRIEVSAKRMEMSESLREFAERCVYFALGRFGQRVELVRVRIHAASGRSPSRSGHYACEIRVRLRGADPAAATVVLADARVAVQRAAADIGRAVARRLRTVDC